MDEPRSLASRFYRFTMRPTVRYFAVLAVVLGWTLVLVASNGKTGDDVLISDLALAGGGALGFMGLFAGISRWVAEPAALKVMAKHTANDAAAHPSLLERSEWHAKHVELLEKINKVHEDMIDELRTCVARERHGPRSY